MIERERERYRFTAEDYMRMANAGVLDPCVRVELIDGDFILMSPIHPPHARAVRWLEHKLSVRLGESALVSAQNAVMLDAGSVLQPDIAVLRVKADFYGSGHPKPEDVLLLIEVADSTVRSDRYDKVPKYGAAGIPETWLVDLPHEMVLVHTEPQAEGYGALRTLRKGDIARPQAFDDLEVNIAELLG